MQRQSKQQLATRVEFTVPYRYSIALLGAFRQILAGTQQPAAICNTCTRVGPAIPDQSERKARYKSAEPTGGAARSSWLIGFALELFECMLNWIHSPTLHTHTHTYIEKHLHSLLFPGLETQVGGKLQKGPFGKRQSQIRQIIFAIARINIPRLSIARKRNTSVGKFSHRPFRILRGLPVPTIYFIDLCHSNFNFVPFYVKPFHRACG